jgi:hypothetical protein
VSKREGSLSRGQARIALFLQCEKGMKPPIKERKNNKQSRRLRMEFIRRSRRPGIASHSEIGRGGKLASGPCVASQSFVKHERVIYK